RRARSALAGFAVPADGEIVRLLRLDLMHGVEDDHAFRDLGRVVTELAAAAVAAPDPEGRGRRHHFISSMICLSSAGIGGIGTRETSIAPSRPLRTTRLAAPQLSLLSG